MSKSHATSGPNGGCVNEIVEVVVSSLSPAELCQRLVHGTSMAKFVQGFHMFRLSNDAQAVPWNGYGLRPSWAEFPASVWEELPHCEAIRSTSLVSDSREGLHTLSLPVLANGVPGGAAVLVSSHNDISRISVDVTTLLSRLLVIAFRPSWSGEVIRPQRSSAEPLELSVRQLEVLKRMSKGRTNRQIASELHVSESTVRHESMRIYKALDVTSRIAAVEAARREGILTSGQDRGLASG